MNVYCKNLLMCEGFEDMQFFKSFIRERNLPRFRVEWARDKANAGGITKFKTALNGLLVSNPTRFRQFENMVIVADNDDAPDSNFKIVRDQIEKIFPGITPSESWVRTSTTPSISILMIPHKGINGNIESFCVDSLRHKNRNAASCIDDLMARVRAETWPVGRRGKAWLRANLAVRLDDPCAPLGEVFRDNYDLFKFDDTSLSPLHNFLSAF